MSLVFGGGAATIITIFILVMWQPFMGPTDFSGPQRGFADADAACIAAWNRSRPRDEFFITGYRGPAIVERLKGECLVSTGLDGYVLRGGTWEKVKHAPHNWHNARHDQAGRLTPANP